VGLCRRRNSKQPKRAGRARGSRTVVRNLHLSIDHPDLVQRGYVRRQTTVHAKHLVVDDGAQTEIVKDICAQLPHIHRPIPGEGEDTENRDTDGSDQFQLRYSAFNVIRANRRDAAVRRWRRQRGGGREATLQGGRDVGCRFRSQSSGLLNHVLLSRNEGVERRVGPRDPRFEALTSVDTHRKSRRPV